MISNVVCATLENYFSFFEYLFQRTTSFGISDRVVALAVIVQLVLSRKIKQNFWVLGEETILLNSTHIQINSHDCL